MKYIRESLPAGQPVTYNIAGRVFLLDEVSGGAADVEVKLLKDGSPIHTMQKRRAGFKVVVDFDAVVITAVAVATVGMFISFDEVMINANEMRINNSAADPVNVLFAGTVAPVVGNSTVTNTEAQKIPVYFPVKQTVSVDPVSFAANQSVNIGNLPSVTFAANQQVNVGTMPAVSLAANTEVITTKKAFTGIFQGAVVTVGTAVIGTGFSDATVKRLIFRNAGNTGNIAIGSASVTIASSAIVLGPGEIWVEDQPGTVTFCAIADVAGCSLAVTYFK